MSFNLKLKCLLSIERFLFITKVSIMITDKAFQSYLANTDFTPLFRSDDIDDALNILNTNLNKYHDHFFPLKVIKDIQNSFIHHHKKV